MPLVLAMERRAGVEQRPDLAELARHDRQELPELLDRAGRQVLRHAAGTDEGVVHPQAGDQLEQVEHLLPLAHPVDEHRGRAQLEAERADPAEVRGDPVQLHHQHPDHAGPFRDPVLDAEQPLHRQAVRGLVEDRHQVVRPGDERHALGPGPVLQVLLDAGVQVADDRPDLGHGLAVQGEDQPQHAVGGRVLRAHVDDDAFVAAGLAGLVGRRDDLVPVLPGQVVDAALGGIGLVRAGAHS